MIVIKIMERDMIVTTTARVTSGSVNLPVKFHFKGDEWDDLVKTAVFIGSGQERDVALITDECAVPADVLAEAGGDLKIGVYGRLANGATVIPTIWGRVQYIYEGTEMSEPSPHDPEPDWTAQVQQAAATALTKATAVEEAAARGDFDGVSPEATIDSITHGHSVTITDREHPEGQSFNVLDGDSAYEQAVAGGYEGTEEQFNEELANFKFLSYAATSAASEANASAQSANRSELRAKSSELAAEDAAAQALIRMHSADASAQAAADSAASASGSASAAAESATAAEEAQGKAEDAQEAAEQAQAAAEEAAQSVDADRINGRLDAVEQTTTATTIGPVAIATFEASTADMPLKGLTVNIEPVQSGSGDPSPDNIRPITGWTGAKVFYPGLDITLDLDIVKNKYISTSGVETDSTTSDNSHTDYFPVTPGTTLYFSAYWDEIPDTAPAIAFYNANKVFVSPRKSFLAVNNGKGAVGYNFGALTVPDNCYYAILNFSYRVRNRIVLTDKNPTIVFPTEAGTVYGGTLDVVNGVLTVDRAIHSATWGTFNGKTTLTDYVRGYINLSYTPIDLNLSDLCNVAPCSSGYTVNKLHFYCSTSNGNRRAYVFLPENTSADLEVTVCYYLANPIPYPLTPQEITTLLGTNSIWADTGDVTVTYGAYIAAIKDYAEQIGDSILSAIAPLEADYTASRAYSVGEFLFVGTKFYKVKSAIGSGGTITPGTNVIQTTVAEQLMSLTLHIATEPQNKTAAANTTVEFVVEAGGGRAPYTYKWYYRNPNYSTGDNFAASSNVTNTYSVNVKSTTHSQGFFVYCVVTDANGAIVISRTAELTLTT